MAAVLAVVGALSFAAVAPAGAAETGDLSQAAGTGGCWADNPLSGSEVAGCSDGTALSSPRVVTASPDGKSVYAASLLSDAVVIFDRVAPLGTLQQKAGAAGCIAGVAGPCTLGTALDRPAAVAVSADNKNVYVASGNATDAVAVFDRNLSTGALVQKLGVNACISQGGTGGCKTGNALNDSTSLAVSADGKNVYVASSLSNAVAVLDRDVTTGALSQDPGSSGCVSEGGAGGCTAGKALAGVSDVLVSPDGKNLYSAAGTSDAIAIFDRDTATGDLTQKAGNAGCFSDTGAGPCSDGIALDQATALAISPDGADVYVAAWQSGAVTRYRRSATTGALLQTPSVDCWQEDGANGCDDVKAIGLANEVAVSPDGRSVYVGNYLSAIANFDRTGGGDLEQKPGLGACISSDGSTMETNYTPVSCVDGAAVSGVSSLAVSPDSQNLYSNAELDYAVGVFRRNDGIPPETEITSGPEGITNETTAIFSFAADEPGATFMCFFGLKDGSPAKPNTPCTSPASYDAPPNKQPYRFAVEATDLDGNTDPTKASSQWEVDTKLKAKLKTPRKQKQKGKRVIVSTVHKVKEPVAVTYDCGPVPPDSACSPVSIRVMLAIGGISQTGVFSVCGDIGREYGLCVNEPKPGRRAVGAMAGGVGFRVSTRPGPAAKCKVTDPCVIGRKVRILMRLKKRKVEKKLINKLKKGKTPKLATGLLFEDAAGNTKAKKVTVKLKP